MTNGKKMYKVLSPIEKKGGGTYWMRLGTGYTNRDDSINLYLDAVPPTNTSSRRYELHIRELTEDDLRKRESAGASPGAPSGTGGYCASSTAFSRDLGGLDGGPPYASAHTAAAGSRTLEGTGAGAGEDVPF